MISPKESCPLRVVTVGEASVGKTALTSRLVDDSFNQCAVPTVGANYQMYTTDVEGDMVEMQIWDTAGQEKYRSLSPFYFKNAAAAIVVFSLINRKTFETLSDWITSFIEVAGPDALIYIAANKSDLINEIEISSDEVKKWASDSGYKYYETSAKTGTNVHEMFDDLAADLKKNYNILTRDQGPHKDSPDKSEPCC